MKKLVLKFINIPENVNLTLFEIREFLLKRMLLLFFILGLPAVVFGTLEAVDLNYSYLSYLYSVFFLPIVFAFLFQKKLSFNVKVVLMLFSGMCLGVVVMGLYGFTGEGIPVFFTVAVLSTVFFGLRIGLFTLLFSAVPIAVVGYLMVNGILIVETDLMHAVTQSYSWITGIFVMLFLGTIAILGYGLIQSKLFKTLILVKKQSAELAKKNFELQTQIEQNIKVQKELSIAKNIAEENEEKFHSFMDYFPGAAFIKNESLELIYVNKYLVENFGADKWLNKPLENIPIQISRIFNYGDSKVLVNNNILYEDRFPLSSGRDKFFSTHKFLINISEDKFFIGAISMDITNRKIAEQRVLMKNVEYFSLNKKYIKQNKDLMIAKREAEKSNALIKEFLKNLSHEIRTPLNAITGFSNLLVSPNKTLEKQKKYTEIIISSSRQLLKIISDIIEISEIETCNSKLFINEIDIFNVCNEIVNKLRNSAMSKGIDLFMNKAITDRQEVVVTDENRLKKVLYNLVENGIKYTVNGYVELGWKISNDFVQFYVKDTGIGIPSEMSEKIFLRFSQGNVHPNDKPEGLGLGLAIVKENVELLHGSVSFKSDNNGSVFYVSLPTNVKKSQLTDGVIEKN